METTTSQNEAGDGTGIETPEIIIDAGNDDVNAENHKDTRDDLKTDRHEEEQEDDKTVTLRRQNVSLDNLSTFTDDDYNFTSFVRDSHGFRSRKKTEIGSEKMISKNVSHMTCQLLHFTPSSLFLLNGFI